MELDCYLICFGVNTNEIIDQTWINEFILALLAAIEFYFILIKNLVNWN